MQSGHQNHPYSGIVWAPSEPADQESELLKHETAESTRSRQRGSSFWVPPKDARLPLKESLGFSGCAGVFGGCVGVLAVFGFLSFLWFGYGSGIEGRNASRFWRWIALKNWMTRTITLTALVLRLMVSIQSVVCTSMIAALFLEKRFARKSNVVHLSILRGINDGPGQLLHLILASRSLSLVLQLEFWLLLVLAVVTIGLQFSSTILVSDLHDFVIVGNLNATQVPTIVSYQIGDAIFLDGSWIERPPVFSVFGEVESQTDITPDSYGLSSTGLIQRGFIPLAGGDNRTSVRHYQGNAIVMNSKVACMRPVLDAQYIAPAQYAASGSFTYGRINGFLDYGASLVNANVDPGAANDSQGLDDVYFDCQVPAVEGVDAPQSSFCLIGSVGGNFWPLLTAPKWNHIDEPWSTNSSIYLVYSTNMNVYDWADAPLNQSILPGTPFGEWETYSPLESRYLNVSLCFSAFDMERQSVDMATAGVLQEPIADWSTVLVYIAKDYNITDIEDYISIDSSHTLEYRHLLNMTIQGAPEDGSPSSPANAITTITQTDNTNVTISFASLTDRVLELLVYFILSGEISPNSTFISCFNCHIYGFELHANAAVVFNEIITSTLRPVQAMQSFMTSLAATIIDDYQSSLGGLQDAKLATTTTARTPGSCSSNGCPGFIAVITLLGIHLICVIAITALYVRQARYSRVGNVWHVISQLMSDELREYFRNGSNKSDKTIERALKRDGNDYMVKIKKSDYDGKIEVVKHVGDDSDDSGPDDGDSSRMMRLRTGMSWKKGQSFSSTH